MKTTHHKAFQELYKKTIIFMIGILISMAGSAMLISNSFNLDKFYDAGAVYDIILKELLLPSEGMIYNHQEKYFEIQGEVANKTIEMSPKHQKKWNYIYMKISQLDGKTINCKITYKDSEGTIVGEKQQELASGNNIIVSENITYSSIILEFPAQAGRKISIDKLQFREQEDVFTWKKAVISFLVLQIIYYGLILLGKSIWKKKINKSGRISVYPFIEKLQLCFIKAGNYAENIAGRCSEKVKYRIRTGIFMFLLFYMQIMCIRGKYITIDLFKYHMYICVIAIILLSVFSWEKPLQMLKWDNRFVRIWFAFWILAIVSEFIVPKRFGYQGIIMIFVMGFFFFVWNNMSDREVILRNFRKALELWFWINVPICYLFRPFSETERYMGMSKNPNVWAMYLIFVLAAFLSEAEVSLKVESRRKKIRRIYSLIGVGIIWDSIIKTGSSSGTIPMILIIGVWGLRQLGCIRREKNRWSKVCYLLVGFVIVILSSRVNDWSLRTIAYKNESSVAFREDEIINASGNSLSNLLSIKAEAAGKLEENRVFRKVFESNSLEEFTSARNVYWRAYIRESNLWGHEFAPLLWGSHRSSHSGFIAIMYRYGILSLVPYIILIGYYMKYSLKYKEETTGSSGIDFFIKAMSIGVFVLLMMENVEFPFYYFSWYALYLVMGMYFGNKPAETGDMSVV